MMGKEYPIVCVPARRCRLRRLWIGPFVSLRQRSCSLCLGRGPLFLSAVDKPLCLARGMFRCSSAVDLIVRDDVRPRAVWMSDEETRSRGAPPLGPLCGREHRDLEVPLRVSDVPAAAITLSGRTLDFTFGSP
jgi:hypothetical protein